MNYDRFEGILVDFYAKVLTYLQPHLSLNEVLNLAANATDVDVEYGKADPYQAAFTVTSVGLTPILGAEWMTATSQIDWIWSSGRKSVSAGVR